MLQCGAVGVRRGGLYRGENKEHKYKRVEGGGALKDFDTLPYLYICIFVCMHTHMHVSDLHIFLKKCVCVCVYVPLKTSSSEMACTRMSELEGGVYFPKIGKIQQSLLGPKAKENVLTCGGWRLLEVFRKYLKNRKRKGESTSRRILGWRRLEIECRILVQNLSFF